ncbi:MAG TPA: proteasome assembly chaperone family protein [Candidatus Nitrosotalea sp.]|nr:proteasome assembly chaperone family protein [Candidatus Nitrosotalea sp.]
MLSLPQRIVVEITEMPVLKNPSLICGFPGSGYVGKLAVDHMIEELKAIPFANMFSSSFPPQVLIQPDGTTDLMKNTFYYYKGSSSDLVILSGDAQPVTPESEYEMAEEIVKICDKLGIKTIYTLAAYITGTFSKTPKVYGTSTIQKIVDDFQNYGVSTMNSGSITGMNGLIIGVGKRKEITGICLLGETSGYVIDAKASQIVLETLSKMLSLKLDLAGITKKAQDTEHLVKTIEEQMRQKSGGDSLTMPQQNKKLGYIS